MGVRSFQGTMLAAKARELECGLNGEMQYCTTLRARWQAWADRKEGAEDINRSRFLEDGLVESMFECSLGMGSSFEIGDSNYATQLLT